VTAAFPAGPERAELDIRRVPFTDPDVTRLSAAAQAYYVSLYGGPDSAPVDVDDFLAPNGAFFVGYAAGRATAMGGWRFYRAVLDIDAAHPAEIKRMWVDPRARRRGLGRALLARIESTALAAGADALVLETGSPQRDAIAMYLAAGYAAVPRFGHYADARDAVHLGKHLGRTRRSAATPQKGPMLQFGRREA
jgi:GNAT superfamily N-acetyltransferase